MQYDSSKFTNASLSQLEARDKLYSLFQNYSAPADEAERSMALFLRGSQLARLLAINEVYQHITSLPGSIMDFGTWRGSTAVLCENYRAIYEPLNFQRKIYAFDTFIGYSGFQDDESKVKNIQNGTYAINDNYNIELEELLKVHEQNNAMGHINGKHHVIKGDVTKTFPQLLEENKGLSIALAFFDLNSYTPTYEVIQKVLDRLLVGGIICIWQFSRQEIQAEAEVFFELIHSQLNYTIHTCKTYPSLVWIKRGK